MATEAIEKELERIGDRQDRQDQMHFETMRAVNDLVSELKVTNANMATVLKEQDDQKSINELFRKDISDIKQTQAGFKPFIKMVESINMRIWFLILGGLGSMAFMVYSIGAG